MEAGTTPLKLLIKIRFSFSVPSVSRQFTQRVDSAEIFFCLLIRKKKLLSAIVGFCVRKQTVRCGCAIWCISVSLCLLFFSRGDLPTYCSLLYVINTRPISKSFLSVLPRRVSWISGPHPRFVHAVTEKRNEERQTPIAHEKWREKEMVRVESIFPFFRPTKNKRGLNRFVDCWLLCVVCCVIFRSGTLWTVALHGGPVKLTIQYSAKKLLLTRYFYFSYWTEQVDRIEKFESRQGNKMIKRTKKQKHTLISPRQQPRA